MGSEERPAATEYHHDLTEEPEVEEEEDDTRCGIGPCKNIPFLQKFANKKVYVIIYGLLGFVFSASYAYSTSTLSTLEKRFKMPSRTTGIISVGNDISSIFASMLLSYYAGKKHRPRWLAFGIYTVALYCFLKLTPHLMWGAGEDALALTTEFGASPDEKLAAEILLTQKRKTLCRAGLNDSLAGSECLDVNVGPSQDFGWAPAFLFFIANFVSGIGGSLYYTLGVSYMDDNIQKSKTPFLVSMSYFMRMLGPAFGYALGSYFLKFYIAPSLTPTISNNDPRWLGAWWAGWWILGGCLVFFGTIIGLFPRTLPRTIVRRKEAIEKGIPQEESPSDEKASLKDMKQTIMRLFTNKIFMCNTLASIFYMFGFMPFWVFTPKYLEFQYRISASKASFYTGSAGLVCSALGVLIAGIVISQFKPRARYLAAWNVFVSVVSIAAIVMFAFIGCEQSDLQSNQMKTDVQQQCNVECRCDFVKYSPVCSEDGSTTFISACHAGCRDQVVLEDGKKVYVGCTCIASEPEFMNSTDLGSSRLTGGRAFPGPCPVDCMYKFYLYIAFVCVLKFSAAAGKTSNFLVAVRCVEQRDKPTSMGLGMVLYNIFVFIPSPIIFGIIIDSTCVVWGRTCTGKGNCWQYDGEAMRSLVNYSAAVFVLVGTVFDVGVWYYVKNLQIFDEETKQEKEKVQKWTESNGTVEDEASKQQLLSDQTERLQVEKMNENNKAAS